MKDTRPRPFVFVLMPFDPSFDDTYQIGIKQACDAAGAYSQRVDEQIYLENTLERIYNQIAKADIIVSDMTERNVNVFYETGYAHALGKQVILLTQNADDIPFDLKQYPHIVYEGSIVKLKTELKKWVRHLIKRPGPKQPVPAEALEYHLEGVNLSAIPTVPLAQHVHDPKLGWTLSFDVHNPKDQTIETQGIQFGLVFPTALGSPILKHESSTKLPNDEWMVSIDAPMRILPKGWFHKSIQIYNHAVVQGNQGLDQRQVTEGKHFPCRIRVFTDLGISTVSATASVGSSRVA
jgi:hypothetical protein